MKKMLLITALIILPSFATAQNVPPEYILKVSPAQLEVIGKALGKLTFDEVATLMQQLRQQVVEQQQKLNPISTPTPSPAPEQK